jgi:hypothetical protein
MSAAPPEKFCVTSDLGALLATGRKFGTIYADPVVFS